MPNSVGLEQFGSITALTSRLHHAVALETLRKAAAQVKPLLLRRNWRVGSLEEFFPSKPELYGLNHNRGKRIQVRLRPADNPDRFLPYESILGTLLHEITHNERGPHDALFYKLLDELTAETEDLMSKGFTGEGFFSRGNSVGSGSTRKISPMEARRIAAEAAERRGRAGNLWGRRLGGETGRDFSKRSPGEMAALAAERRRADSTWCGNQETGPTPAEEETILTKDIRSGDTEANRTTKIKRRKSPDPSSSSTSSASSSNFGTCSNPKPSRSEPTVRTEKRPRPLPPATILVPDTFDSLPPWPCPSCTFLNAKGTLACEICTAQRPFSTSPSSASDLLVMETPENGPIWICPLCTCEISTEYRACTTCEFVRKF